MASARRPRDLSDTQLCAEIGKLFIEYRHQGELDRCQERRWASLITELERRPGLRLPECYCEECWPYTAAARQFG